MTVPFLRAAAAAAALGLAACAGTTPAPQVTRFHLNAPIPQGTVFVEAVDPAAAGSLEYRSYADEVARGWQRLGFQPARTRAEADYVSTVLLQSATRPRAPRQSPVSIGVGVGGGSFGRRGGSFGGGSVGVGLPLGGARRGSTVAFSELTVTLRRASDASAVWEGRAGVETLAASPNGSLTSAVPQLVDALFGDFPGRSGETTRYRPRA